MSWAVLVHKAKHTRSRDRFMYSGVLLCYRHFTLLHKNSRFVSGDTAPAR